jgi:hypothetical protein
MKKIFVFAAISTMIVFSLNASATGFTFESLAKTGTDFQWVLYGLGALCFMELRKEYQAD